jgi:hypothetical protein
MENSNRAHSASFYFACDFPNNEPCETQGQIFRSYIYRIFAKKYDIKCNTDVFHPSNFMDGKEYVRGMICEVGTQLPAASSAQASQK